MSSEEKIYYKIAVLMHKCGIDYNENKEVINSFEGKLNGLFSAVSTNHKLEALEFVLAGKPKDIIEAYHLLNLFTISDYMRMIGCQLHSQKITHEQNQEYIKIAGKTAEQYSKGMLSLKMYRDGLPQINKVQNNTLNQVNINKMEERLEQKTKAKPKSIEQNEGLKVEEIAINEKEKV